MQKIQGAFTALATPFSSENTLAEDVLRQMIRLQIASEIDGLVILGTTGESPTLSQREKERIIGIAREETLNKIHLMVGTGSYSTTQTIENTKIAQSLGADSALVVSPYYNKPTQEGLFLHFKAIAESTDIPIMVYNIQGRTGQNIKTDTLNRIAQLPRICGVKEASSDLSQITEVIEKIGRQFSYFSVMSGDDFLTLPAMSLGSNGVISVVSNLVPLLVKTLVNACLSGDFVHAREIHYSLMPLFRGAFLETNPIPIKAAMNLLGIPVGNCRLPLCNLAPENKKKLEEILNDVMRITGQPSKNR
jgi:4-hydroxy-tetrahydrodipicolinate synthase